MICQSRQQVLGHSCVRCWLYLVNPRPELEGIACSLISRPGLALVFGSPGLLGFLLDSGQGGSDVETLAVYPQGLSCALGW